MGKYAVTLINKQLDISLPESEATAIAMHFLNAKLNSPAFEKEQAIATIVKNIETIVTRSLSINFNKESFSYSRFLTHLTYFADRIYEKKPFIESDDDNLYHSLQKTMPTEANAITCIQQFILSQYDVPLSTQEKIYLLVHLHRLVNETSV